MQRDGMKRALICYAGSAPEASISSKPIGSELEYRIYWNILTKQEQSASIHLNASNFARQECIKSPLVSITSNTWIQQRDPNDRGCV